MGILTNTLTNDSAADADEVMANFNDLVTAVNAIRNANVASDAAVASSKLAEPYATWEETFFIVPFSDSSDWNTPTMAATNFPTAFATIYKRRVTKPTDSRLWLCLFEVYALDVTAGVDPELNLLVDSVQMGGAAVALDTDDNYYSLENASPIANPLIPLANNTEIEIQLREASSGSAELRAVVGRFVFKRSMVA